MSRRMQRRMRKWFNWRTWSILLVALILVIAVGQIFGIWEPIWRRLFGTTFPPPPNGYTCLPTCVENDAKFLSMPGENMASFGGEEIVVWVSVPAQYSSFELSWFDGDSGKDNAGNIYWYGGNWDNTTTETTYTLYADPYKDGTGTQVVRTWSSNQMPNNAWFNDTIPVGPEAQAPSEHYFYRLECTRPVQGHGINALKLRSNAYLSTGRADLVDANFAIVGMMATVSDIYILYPQFNWNFNNLGPSPYTGDWTFHFYVPGETTTVEFWDGDFDRGTSYYAAADGDDPNTSGKPPWASPFAQDEGAWGQGNPADDFSHPLWRRNPPVWYEIIDPNGQPFTNNYEPSGTEEWEWFSISTDGATNPDHLDSSRAGFEAGFYVWHISGLDVHNTVWIRTNYEICAPEGCGPCVWCVTETCPRTIGYWKNNVRKVLIEGQTQGTQETRESLEAALDNVAKMSVLYRSGINVAAPAPIANAVRLTDQEANAILQKAAGNTMLDRALQQNLATWLNLASGKISGNAVIRLDWGTGTFAGTVEEALREAEQIILYGGDLERAKSMADQINNGLLGEEAEDSVCSDYEVVMPPDKQPPNYEDLPEGPKPPEPPNPDVGCDAPRVNQYGVENPTNSPFHGIKFEYQSGTEVKDGARDVFELTLTTDQATALTSIQLEAKAGGDQAVAQVSLEGCHFDEINPCETVVQDPNGFFTFTFLGAADNGDGTMTLRFDVQNHTAHGLSHVTIGLPDGVVASSPSGSYESQVCP